MHKKTFIALAGVVTLSIVAGVASFSPGPLLSSVLTTTTPLQCTTEEMHVSDAQKALDAFSERANITERVTDLEKALATAQNDVNTLSDKVNAALKKTRYTTLEAFQKDLKTYNDLLAEYTRLTMIRPRTAAVSKLITANTKLRSAHNALVKKTTKSSLTIAQLNARYIVPNQKDIEALSDARTALRTAQTTLSEARAEQDKIQQAENNLKEVQADLEKCRAQNPVIGDDITGGDKKYCYPVRINDSGEVQTDCVDDITKIPQCYIKSTVDTIYDEEGNLSSVNVKSDIGTGALFFCGTPETAYQDPSNPLSNYPTIPGAGSQPGAEAAAPMATGNPNQPANSPTDPINTSKKCEDGTVVYGDAKCPEEAICGNQVCEYGEDNTTCDNDCSEFTNDLPNTCGDGKIDPGEQCDDGKKQDDVNSCNGCAYQCNDSIFGNNRDNIYIFGNRAPKTREETNYIYIPYSDSLAKNMSDDYAKNMGACLYTLTPCGNGKIDRGNDALLQEACDDGNTDNNDGCSSTCHMEICGDNITQTTEECDEGLSGGNTCTSDCKKIEIRRPE